MRRRIHDIPEADRPREKIKRTGAPSLSDFELLEVIIGNGIANTDVSTLARQVQRLLRRGTAALSYDALIAIKGVSDATASRILASLELAKRHLILDATPLLNQSDIVARLGDIRARQQEYVICMTVDGGLRLIAQRVITIGTLDTVIAHPREVFADAIADRAASIIIAHNHPSGDAQPSQKDVTLTQQLAAAGQVLGISVRDHIIVTKSNYFSFRQHHLL